MNRKRPNRQKRGQNNRGQGGGQIARKASNNLDSDDLIDYEEEFTEESSEEDDEWEIDDDEVEGLQRDLKSDPQKPAERRKVEMQILHMSDQSQQMITQMLKEIHGSQYKMKDASTYTDCKQRIDRRFWIQDRLRVTNVIDFSNREEEKPEETYDQFALKKLESYGFHSSRCIEALNKANGDVGQAFEDLMVDLFQLNLEPEVSEDDDQKEDEKLAIQSIYGDEALTEKIPGKLWELQLELPSLLDLMSEKSGKSKSSQNSAKITHEMLLQDKNVCQFFLRGHCKFGRKCYKKHVQADQKVVIDDKHLSDTNEDTKFILEIRFREGNFAYPQNPPLVSLNTKYSKIPRQACLKVTARLMEEAKNLSLDQCPSVFSLINLLDDLEEMKKALNRQDISFSFAAGLEPTPNAGTAQDRLMASLGFNSSMKTTAGNASKSKLPRNLKFDNKKILERYDKKIINKTMLETRQALPAWNEQEKILKILDQNQVLVISGMTGCGKSTQVPQYILDAKLKSGQVPVIICTQPRRISAIGVAERVAQERDEKIGNLIGYQIRLESKTSTWTRLLFCTTGILLRRLESDPELNQVTHVIIDEVHERSEESDFLLMIIRDLLPRRPNLKIILMSATLNATSFASYFGQAVPVIDIPGRTFPVEQFFLEDILENIDYSLEEFSEYAKKIDEKTSRAAKKINKMGKDIFIDDYEAEMLLGNDEQFKAPKDSVPDEKLNAKQIHFRYSRYSEHVKKTLSLMDFEKINNDLIEAVLVHILNDQDNKAGSILVFLPGLQEIMTFYEQIIKHPLVKHQCQVLPLHSSLSSEDQSLIFSKTSKRKVVLSTNLAETSITIDDCVYVIEVGKMKEKRFDPTKNMESLDSIWVSRANALQRKGRAGRVQAGICFHLYTKFRYDHHFRGYPVPEIQRVPLEQMLLRIKIMPLFHNKAHVHDVLNSLIEPPQAENVKNSLDRLRGVGAIDFQENLTPLGFHLASLPVDVRIGKLLILGAVFKCLDSALTIAACLSYKSPFVAPFGKREEARRIRQKFSAWNSDQITDLRAYNEWRTAQKLSYKAGYAFTTENFLSIKTMQTIVSMKHQFAELLASIGFIQDEISTRRLERSGKNGTDGIEAIINPEINVNNKNGKLLVSLLCASLYPNVVQILSPKTKFKQTSAGAMAKVTSIQDLRFRTKHDGFVHLHPSSVIAHAEQAMDSAYIMYHEKVKTSRIFVRECSLVPVYSMVLFGGYGVDVELQRGQFVISMEDGWIKFVTFSHVIAECLKEMRRELDQLLEEKIANPDLDLTQNVKGKLIIDTIVKLVQKE